MGTGIALGALTGGVGLAAGALAFGGLSAAGAIAGGLASAADGGLTSKPFQPVANIVIPAVAGGLAGNLAKINAIRNLAHGVKAVKAAVNIAHTVKAISTRSKIIADMQRQIAASSSYDVQLRQLNDSRQKLDKLKAANVGPRVALGVPLKNVPLPVGQSATTVASHKKSVFDTKGAIVGAIAGIVVGGPPGAAVGGIVGGITAKRTV